MSGRHRPEAARSELRGELCGSAHPERPEVLCDRHSPCLGRHSSVVEQVSWEGRPVPSRRSRTVEMTRIANDAARSDR